jgi:hypothetical protein
MRKQKNLAKHELSRALLPGVYEQMIQAARNFLPVRRIAAPRRHGLNTAVAVWLTERFRFAGEATDVLFLPNQSPPPKGKAFDAVIDFGPAHAVHSSPLRKSPEGGRTWGKAARAVWTELLIKGRPVAHLIDLIDAVEDERSAKTSACVRGLYDLFLQDIRPEMRGYQLIREWLDKYDRELKSCSDAGCRWDRVPGEPPAAPGT